MMLSHAKTWYWSVLAAAATVPPQSTGGTGVALAWSPSLSRHRSPPRRTDVWGHPLQSRHAVVASLAASKSSDDDSSTGQHQQPHQRRMEVDEDFNSDLLGLPDSESSAPTANPRSSVIKHEADDNTTVTNGASSEPTIPHTLAKKIRVAKAQAEIDRILSLPDSPFDAEAELEKVISIAPRTAVTVTTATSKATQPKSTAHSPSSNDLDDTLDHPKLVDALSPDLEAELYQAVKQQDYDMAARKRRALDQSHMDDSLAVLQVNAAFYKAFSKKDTRLMESLWLQDDCVTSIHPSHEPIVGCKAVNLSWKRMFSSSNGSFQRNWMEPCNIRLAVKGGGGTDGVGGTMAIVTCDERIYARRFVRGQRRQTELVNLLTATNIFRKVDSKWYMVHHHASWHVDSEVAKHALQQASGSSVSPALIDSLNKRQQATEQKEISMDGILGIPNFGPLLGDSKVNDTPSNKPPQSRIVMGSLSDILNGSLGDLLGHGGSDKKDASANNEGGAIIQFHQLDSEMDDDDEDDDEDEDDQEEMEGIEIVESDGSSSSKEAVSIIKEWVESRGKQTKGVSKAEPAASKLNERSHESATRQRCITSLRHLCQQGLISNRQKRVLLTDIVSCAAKTEKSMVEVAYELLLLGNDDDDDEADDNDTTLEDQRAMAQEEFADQCRIFAESHGFDSALR